MIKGCLSTHTHSNMYPANSYPSQLVPNTKLYPNHLVPKQHWPVDSTELFLYNLTI